jgi:hypothetical protein
VHLTPRFYTYHTLTMGPHSLLKQQKIGHSTQRRLGEFMAMDRLEREGTTLSEAVKLAARHHIWFSSRPPTGNVANSDGSA